MAASKVVRVEDVLQEGDRVSPMQLLGREEHSGESKSTHGSLSVTALESQKDGSEAAEEEAEAEDEVYPLPENWPRIKQLSRPMSCALSKSRMPCVRKAVSHMELIQNIIEEWFKRTVEEIKSRSSTRCSTASAMAIPKKQLRFRDPSVSSHSRSAISSMSKVSSRGSSATLSVHGLGVDSPESAQEAEEQDDEELDVPYLGAGDVIDEVITLLARLETDRQDTLKRFKTETAAGVTLKQKIDDLCLRRLRELPILVQREHEACIVDLNELQWHLAYTTRTLSKAQKRKDTAELMNSRLKEDIEFVKTHIPLVGEKLVLELEAMDRIKKAQVETNQELMTTKQRQAKTEQKSEEALNKAETERGHIKRELDNVRDNLTLISEELSEAKMTFNSYVHQVDDIGNQLVDNSQELKVLEVKVANVKAAEEMQATKVHALQVKITDAEFEYRRLENENSQAEEELKIMRARNASKLAELERKRKVLEDKHRKVVRRNEELTIDIGDTQEKINRCDQQKIADDKNICRIQREMDRVATMMAATMEEHNSVSSINHHIRDQLNSEQEKAFRTEESLKNRVETLRRQVKEEMHNRTVLQARINSDTAEIDKTRSESAKKKEKADKVANDVGSAVTSVLEKVQKLRSAKAKKNEQKQSLSSQIDETKKQHAQSLQQFGDRLSTITPHYNILRAEVGKLAKELEQMAWKADMMNKKIEEMDASQNMMKKLSVKTEAAVEALLEEQDELNKQLEAARKLDDDLKVQLQGVIDRLVDGESRHSRFLLDRKSVLYQQDDDKVNNLGRNKDLASRYRQLQNQFLVTKEKSLRDYDERLKLESTISDIKQLKSLQSKMHGALAEFFKLNGLYNEGELTRLEQVSSENGLRVGKLQSDMEDALGLITDFLQTKMDGTRARQMAWEAVQRMEEQKKAFNSGRPDSSAVLAS
ncbi:coiled-coil domain-containing protein 178-like [Littorina saxatilis]|uniref:Coiled-coil domain-containing protein 178 n=1 Tax=Littorina saxatilis TaxID=31220 RepID=A0AAN9B7I4_9CAEN